MCYMETVSHRDMRNHSGEILRRVEAGESVQVTNRGRLVAMLVPAAGSAVDDLIARNGARAPRASRATLLGLEPSSSDLSSRDLVDDVRGRW